MSDTTETAVRRLRDSPAIDGVRERVRETVDEELEPFALLFAELFLSKAPSEFLQDRDPETLAHLTLGAFEFLGRTRRDRVDVEVSNPDTENEGWYAPVTVVRTNITERPFIVDTIRETLHAQELAIENIVYPVLEVHRDEEGRAVHVGPSENGSARESLVHCEVTQITDSARLATLQAELRERLTDVVRATDDFPAMVQKLDTVIAELERLHQRLGEEGRGGELDEIQTFLEWLRDGGFVFLGYRSYDLVSHGPEEEPAIVVTPDSGLGVLRVESESSYASPVPLSDMPDGFRERVMQGPTLIISKTNAESTVHRRARMDYIGVKKLDASGAVVGEHRFLGLFTSRAYAEDAENIPILRDKLRQILEQAGVAQGSHDYKEIITIFNSLPKEELFLASADEVGEDVRTVLTAYHTSGVRVSLREDPLHRGASVMVILPKDKFSGEVRRAIEASLVELVDAEILNYHLALGEGDQARLHFYVAAPEERLEAVDSEAIEAVVTRLIRSWSDRVRAGLERVRPPDEARRLSRVYGDAFSGEYQAATDPDIAVADLLELEAMVSDGRDVAMGFANRGTSVAAPGVDEVTEFKLFLRDERLILSDFMPILDNLGLRVIAVNPFDVRGDEVGRATLYTFAVQDGAGKALDIEDRGDLLAETILAVRAGEAVNDSLNRLVLTAGLHWREVDVIRAYTGYAFQIGAVPSRLTLPAALLKHPGIARLLFGLFRARFDPRSHATLEDRQSAAADIRVAFQGSLRSVDSLGDDRALRRLEELISATVRTNYFRHGGSVPTFRSGGAPYISFKIACKELELLARNRLLFEVWVHSARMEGVHLRGARVARGGIRWSDRPDDFRTEILGLVKTQVVKNAVIVPGGSKGGFVTRIGFDDPEERYGEGKRQYQTLVRGLLDVTDNLTRDGEVLPPESVVAFDEPDPYLVVAADKGTATFSDVANEVAEEYGFWLGDAFASGGSQGYDHKEVGITARGAWECVKRHFREKGKDIQQEPFTVVGIGDMSGDVFGNGMLLSRQIRLIAAFDHRHVFIDPDPDPATSYAERERLFQAGRTSWADYDTSVLSEGGMIVPRATKEVELGPEARRALGIEVDGPAVMDGEALVRAVLTAPAELLWNGGIGTYVKSRNETHNDAGDPANDAVRVDAHQLRCQVVGEGGNLGFTQQARIEYALRGGAVNTDALDNSGGVDMSDHEVNLKILLAPLVSGGEMSEEDRNELLKDLTEPVAELVLDDNRSQSLAISLDELRARDGGDDFRDLMFALEKTGELDRAAEGLPTLDVLVERRDGGRFLTRPELCVLLAHSKLALKTRLTRGTLPDDPAAQAYIRKYFPDRAEHAAGNERLRDHRLRREIVACQLTNDLVDLMGATFVSRMMRDTGSRAEDVARAWLVASRLSDHDSLLNEMSRQQSALNTRVSYRWLLGLGRVLERTTRWVVANTEPGTAPGEIVDANAHALARLRTAFADIVAGEERSLFVARVRELQDVGAGEEFSRSLITLRFLDQLLEIVAIARETEVDEVIVGRVYYRLAEALEVPWLRRVALASAENDYWEQRAARTLVQDLSRAHRRLVATVVTRLEGDVDPNAGAQALLDRAARDVEHFGSVLDEIRAEEESGLAAASVAIRQLTSLAERAAAL